MKLKSWLRYLAYALIILVLVFTNSFIFERIRIIQNLTYTISYVWLSVTIIINMILGALLGIEYLINETRKSGSWKLNSPKIMFMVIPSLYLSLFLLFNFTVIGNIYNPVIKHLSSNRYSLDVIPISQVLFGYFIVTSFYKQSKITE